MSFKALGTVTVNLTVFAMVCSGNEKNKSSMVHITGFLWGELTGYR